MGFVNKLMGNRPDSGAERPPVRSGFAQDTTDGAIDTLGTIVRTMGDSSFEIDDGAPRERFQEQCAELACHVGNGAAVPSLEIPASENGERRWGHVRRFFIDRRANEKTFVEKRMSDYRGVVDELVGGLREIGLRDRDTEICVQRNLRSMETAVASSQLPEIKATLNEAVRNIAEKLARQKQEYERQIGELNQRMSSLREDLVSVREKMKRDSLTGTFNRGAFDQAIVQSLNINFILNQPVTVIFIDLDYFKNINDTYGHAAGDEVLRSVGDALARSFIRKTDFVARFGGDEFAVILTDTTAANCATLLSRYYDYISEITVPYAKDDEVRVSCSAGYTELTPGDTVESLIKRVDSALYAAKAAGRNCYKFAPAPEPGAEDCTL